MAYLYVRQRVADFDHWYKIFKSHAQAQREAGLKNLQLLRDVADQNIIVCIFEVENLEKARAFTEAPEASIAQKESGIIGEPEVLFLEEV